MNFTSDRPGNLKIRLSMLKNLVFDTQIMKINRLVPEI